jgi:serine/threonine protein kinase
VKIHHYRASNENDIPGSQEKRYGRHGDLKPENILWFPDADGGTLKISDFGLADYSTINSKSYLPKSRVATSMSYRPPECDIEGGIVGPSYDIWTLGCLYLEFTTWLLGGWQLVKDFEMKRMSYDPLWFDMKTDTFFELVRGRGKPSGQIAARVKSSVTAVSYSPPDWTDSQLTFTQFIHRLHAHECCSEFLHDFLNMIQFDMLIVKPIKREEKGRFSSEQVHKGLAAILKGGEGDGYFCEPAAWCSLYQTSDDAVEMNPTYSVAMLMERKMLPEYEGRIQEREK